METSGSIVREITINADNATVLAFFTDAERLIRWIGSSAQADPRPGGLLLVDVQQGYIARGEFREVVPVSRLVFTFGWEGNKENVPPGSSICEVDLSPTNGHTLLRFRHSGLPPEAVPGHSDGWSHYLGRLALAASGIDPGPDPRRAGPDPRQSQ
jgi:uncharacterized protein YndB with AHSA1/START domain